MGFRFKTEFETNGSGKKKKLFRPFSIQKTFFFVESKKLFIFVWLVPLTSKSIYGIARLINRQSNPTVCLSFYLSNFSLAHLILLSVCLLAGLPAHLSRSLSLPQGRCICYPNIFSICLSICLDHWLSLWSIHLSAWLSVCLYVVFLSVHFSACLYAFFLSVHLSVPLSVNLFVNLFSP